MTLSERRLAQSREWAAKNRERKRELNRKWKLENPERTKEIAARYRNNDERRKAAKECSARWRAQNPGKTIEMNRRWRDANPDWKTEWLRKNPDHYRINQQNRRSRKKRLADVFQPPMLIGYYEAKNGSALIAEQN